MIRRISFRSVTGIGVALSLAAMPAPAMAGGFTPEGQQHWVAVARALIDASNGAADAMGVPCKGVTIMGGGSEIRKESSQVPKWAVMAHFQTCIAFQGVASRESGKGKFMSSTTPCKGIKAAIDELDKAKAGVDPDEVVAVAGKLKTSLISLVTDYQDAKACKFRPVGLL